MFDSNSLITSSICCIFMLACGSTSQEGAAAGGTGFNVATGGNANSNGGTTSIGTGCAQQQVPINAIPPDILIIQDRSESMTDNSNDQTCRGGCGTTSKWSQVTTAIETVVNATSGSVNWGLFYFGNGVTECGVNTTPAVPVSSTSAAQIVASLGANAPSGATPTTATVNNAVAYMKTLTDPNPKYFLLATDGEPNCLGGNANNTDDTGAINAIANAKTAGYPTFVVGIGNVSTSTATLNSMAVAGGYPQTGATTQYYAVVDTASLETALTQIVGMVASCTISLANTPSGQWTIAIFATENGTAVQIPSSTTNGWTYTDSTKTSITLVGSTCDNLKNGTYSKVQFVYTCVGGVIVPPPVTKELGVP